MGSEETVGGRAVLDLFVLVADKNMAAAVRGVLSRPEALRIRPIHFEVAEHPHRDPGVFHEAPEYLRDLQGSFRYALALLDHEGSGREESMTAQGMEKDLSVRMERSLDGPCAALVIDPELEVWVWSDSPEVDAVLGWRGGEEDLRGWLTDEGFLEDSGLKPDRPKEAVERALRRVRRPRSSALFNQLASRVSLERCHDPAFRRLCRILREWFA